LEDYSREENWSRFFNFLNSGMPDSIISDLLKTSWRFNVKYASEKYQKLLSPRLFKEETFAQIENCYKGRTYRF